MTVRQWRLLAVCAGTWFVVGSVAFGDALHGWQRFVVGVTHCLGSLAIAAYAIVRAEQIINRERLAQPQYVELAADVDRHMTELAREMTER
jgi:type VI protein secretion system component VasK